MNAFRTAVVALVLASLPLASPARAESPDRVLIFTKTAGFRHDAIPTAVATLTTLATILLGDWLRRAIDPLAEMRLS